VRWLPAIAALTIVAIGGWMIVSEVRRRSRGPADHSHPDQPSAGTHSHDGVTHSHVQPGTAITWRSLFALGLAGGIIPSTSALLILLGTIAAGRAAFGVVLVVAFGLGMALVMSGVGLAMIFARGRLDRLPSTSRLGSLSQQAPLVAGIVVLSLGLWLTVQALAGPPPL
jgi:ABC-type nickel/cobalt efflux system permease component RcnA